MELPWWPAPVTFFAFLSLSSMSETKRGSCDIRVLLTGLHISSVCDRAASKLVVEHVLCSGLKQRRVVVTAQPPWCPGLSVSVW